MEEKFPGEYNQQHWLQKHKDEPKDAFATYIVPINHEQARALLKEKSFRKKTDTSDSDQPTNPNRLPKLPTKDVNNDEQTPTTVQKSLSNFVLVEEKQLLEHLQKDVNRMLVMLQSLTVGENTLIKATWM